MTEHQIPLHARTPMPIGYNGSDGRRQTLPARQPARQLTLQAAITTPEGEGHTRMTQTRRRPTPPVATPSPQPIAAAHATVTPPAQTVCVIEDDQDIRSALRYLLEDAGYLVIEASDGLTGYALLQRSAERLVVLLDHKLPQMDGCDLLELAANDETLRSRHVFILVTASPKRAEEDCGDHLEELNAPVVPKPFDIDEVLDAVTDAATRLN